MDRDGQIKAIEKTFEDNKRPIERHYSKSNVVPIEILPVYPDFKVLLLDSFSNRIFSYLIFLFSIYSCGNILALKLFLILILRQLVDRFLLKSKKCPRQ